MKKKFSPPPLAVAAFVLILVVAMPWMLPPNRAHSDQWGPREPAGSNKMKTAPIVPKEKSKVKEVSLEVWMQDQATRIGAVDPHPEQTEKELEARAEHLKTEELTELEKGALEVTRAGDQRFLSVEMLVRNPSLQSAQALGRIVTSRPSSQSPEPGLESILRARALEGLGSHPRPEAGRILENSLSRLSDRFLLDRGQRVLQARRGIVPPVEKQDRQSLEKLIH